MYVGDGIKINCRERLIGTRARESQSCEQVLALLSWIINLAFPRNVENLLSRLASQKCGNLGYHSVKHSASITFMLLDFGVFWHVNACTTPSRLNTFASIFRAEYVRSLGLTVI